MGKSLRQLFADSPPFLKERLGVTLVSLVADGFVATGTSGVQGTLQHMFSNALKVHATVLETSTASALPTSGAGSLACEAALAHADIRNVGSWLAKSVGRKRKHATIKSDEPTVAPAQAEGAWVCGACTFVNTSSLRRCDMCFMIRGCASLGARTGVMQGCGAGSSSRSGQRGKIQVGILDFLQMREPDSSAQSCD